MLKCPNCSKMLRSTSKKADFLSPRQFRVAMLCSRGMTRDEIAKDLNLTSHNVGQQILIAKNKLGARNDVELALFMLGLLENAVKVDG